MTERQMPARIWTYRISNFTEGYWRTRRATSNDTCYVRSDIAERMAEALEGLVRINEEHNEAISQIIGHPLNWKDDYLDQARSALSAFRSATQDTEARHD
jgi:hypothetical protein